ncbi:metallophosphoesterase [Salipaludibacillus sp. CF4.18]|uniref:metallophosphoesterase n=1 Tax=Salipaludibacillus sp. CF4.18 TaxID=3373081 RepID=UPI003EE64268
MNVKFLLSFSTFLLIYSLLSFYIGWNIHVWLLNAFQIDARWGISVFLMFFAYSYIIGQMVKSLMWLKMLGSFWLAVFQFALIVLPVVNLFVWLISLTTISLNTSITTAGFLVLILFIVYMLFGLFNAYQPVIRKYHIEIPRKQAKKKTLRVAMASDMHFGGLSGKNHAKRLVTMINKLDPDLIVFPGDLVDDDPGIFQKEKMDKTLRNLQAPLGVYAVLGNHEYYGGKIKELTKIMKKVNVHILQDEIVTIDRSIQIIGRKDKTDKHRKTMEELLIGADSLLPKLVLDHQPSELQEIMDSGSDIVLSGHTHRGQIAPNHLITRKIFEVDWGFKKKEQLNVIVSSGFGFWGPPIRIGSRSEIIQLDITFTD